MEILEPMNASSVSFPVDDQRRQRNSSYNMWFLLWACSMSKWQQQMLFGESILSQKKTHSDSQGTYSYIGLLRPKETGKFATNPGFHQMNTVIHHITTAAVLDCWRLEVQSRFPEISSLEEFSKSEMSWEALEDMAQSIVDKYVTGPTFSESQLEEPMK